MLDREAVYTVVEVIKGEDFYREAHREIFEAILDLVNREEPIDLVAASEKLRSRGTLERVGGISYVAALVNAVPTAANAAYYAKIVAEKALLRNLISVANRIANQSYEAEGDVEEILDEAESQLFALSQHRQRSGFVPIREVLLEAIDRIELLTRQRNAVTGVPTFPDLDRLLSGLQDSDLVLCAARPAMGKTTFCLNVAQNAAIKNKIGVAVFSLEMSKDQLAQRMLCAEAMVDQQKLRTGFMQEDDWSRLIRAAGPLSEASIFIDDTPAISIMEVRAKSRRLKAEKDIGLIVIDYLQLIHGSKKTDNRQQEISEISRSLKALARELRVPVLALSQLSRASEQTHDKRPSLSHLRESGALEQDSDIVLFIHRPEYYDPESEKKGIAELIIAKHRNGPVGSVELGFLKQFTKFVNLDDHHSGERM